MPWIPAPARAQAGRSVAVLYAGSLVTPMEGPVKAVLAADGVSFEGQGGGSRMLANLIASGVKNPDAFVAVDPALVIALGNKVVYAAAFASTSLGVGWTDASRDASAFDDAAAGKRPLLGVLQTPGLSIGRTDPRLDPKGAYTVEAVKLLAGPALAARILGPDENPAQTFPEEDLIARVETGQADVGFFYRTEAAARGLRFMPLPGAAALSQKITYVIAIMRDAPHPQQADAFADFVLRGQGKAILRAAGLEYFRQPRVLRDFRR